MSAITTESAGRRFGGYEILGLLRNDDGVRVYQARQLALHRTVRLAVLPAAQAAKPVFRARFEREVAALLEVRHDNVLGAIDAGEIDGDRFVVTEDATGRTLADALDAGRGFASAESLRLVRDVALALDAFEKSGLCHRNVAPRAIVLTDAGVTKLAGLSRVKRSEPSSEETWYDVLNEDAPYRPPEAVRGGRLDIRGDIYSLGCVLYRLLAGRPPFRGPNAAVVLAAHVQRTPRAFRSRRPEVPEAAETVALACLAKSRAERYQRTSELLLDLEDAIAGRPVRNAVADAFRRTR